MLNWRLQRELLGKTWNVVDDGLKGDVRVYGVDVEIDVDVDYCG